MSDMMTFPITVEEFMEQYKVVDTEKIYTNGVELVPIFRMMQWFEHVSATDTISRQQSIDALKELTANGTNKGMVFGEDAVHRIEMLPPSQPELCEDAVSRKAVIDSVRQDCFAVFTADEREYEIRDLPSVTPKQRTGKWIFGDMCSVIGYWVTCSACGHTSFGGGKFCRECGAKMEGVSNDT